MNYTTCVLFITACLLHQGITGNSSSTTVAECIVPASVGAVAGSTVAAVTGQSKKTGAKIGAAVGVVSTVLQDMAVVAQHGAPKKELHELVLSADVDAKIVFLHGAGGGSSDCAPRFKHYFALPQEVHSFDFPCSAKNFEFIKNVNARHLMTFTRCAFAQEPEIQHVVDNYSKIVSEGKRVILFGFSNGGANALTTMGTHDLQNVAGLVVIAPYDNPVPLMEGVAGGFTRVGLGALRLTSGYNPRGINPDMVVTSINPDIPVFIACSRRDNVTGLGGVALAHKLKAAGHKNVFLVVINRGDHNDMFEGPDGYILRNAVHAFFKKIGQKYSPDYAKYYDIEQARV
ncbi:MAG TPA: alpha/beta hydrolase [Candidatus Limnocylindria bacterium]|nr:alpha/beta hydrolase [Candidatus Limnocylindria bacterium]